MADAQRTTLRDMLSASMDAVEGGAAATIQDAPPITEPTPDESQVVEANNNTDDGRPRDEQGRFAAKAKDEPPQKAEEQKPPEAQQVTAESAVTATPEIQRPSTWKKEYLPIYDKIATGQSLTPDEAKKLAAYTVQREREYATGVSTYKQEALNARHLNEALAPFAPLMQRQNMQPQDLIKNLGSTYQFLVEGNPQQKLQAFAQLAQSVGIPLHAIAQSQGGQLDPIVPQLMQHIQELKSQVSNVSNWREQQEQQEIQQQISKFANNPQDYPHFETVRGTMGRLLESGLAQDLDTAYAKAVRMHDDVWQEEMTRQASPSQPVVPAQDKAAAAATAKAKAVSVKSATPTGTTKPVNAKDLRSVLESNFESLTNSRF